MIDISLPPRSNIKQALALVRGKEVYEQNLRQYLPDNSDIIDGIPRQVRPILPGRYYNIVNNEQIATYGSFTIERTQTISYKGWYYHTLVIGTPERILVSNFTSPPTYQGFEIAAFYDIGTNPDGLRFYLGNDVATNNYLDVTTPQNIFAPDTWYYIEVDYDGSSTANGVTLKVNGVVQTKVVENDNLSASIVNNSGIRVGRRFYEDKVAIVSQWELAIDGTLQVRCNCEEGRGLRSFDCSGNGNHASINLNGSTEDDFYKTTNDIPSRANEVGYNRGLFFDGASRVDIPASADLAGIADVKIEIDFLSTGGTARQDVAGYLHSDNDEGFYLRSESNQLVNRFGTDGGSILGITLVGHTAGNYFTTTSVWRGTGASLYSLTTNVGSNSDAHTRNLDLGNDIFSVGCLSNYRLGTFVNYMTGFITKVRIVELDGSGNEAREFVNLDIANARNGVVRNIGTDSIGDGTWVGNEAYVDIPIDESNPTQDVFGNTLPDEYIGQVRYDAQIKGFYSYVNDGANGMKAESSLVETLAPSDTWELEFVGKSDNLAAAVLASLDQVSPYTGFLVDFRVGGEIQVLLVSEWNVNTIAATWDISAYDLSQLNHYVITYDASGLASGLNLTVNGSDLGSPSVVTQDTLGANSYSNNRTWLIGQRGSPSVPYEELQLAYLTFKVNGVVEIDLDINEGGNGLNLLDKSVNAGHFLIDLNGEADGTQWVSSESGRPTLITEGFNKAAYFDLESFLRIDTNAAFETDDFTLELKFNLASFTNVARFYYHLWSNESTARHGWVFYHDGTQFRVITAIDVTTIEINNLWVHDIVLGTTYTVSITKSGTSLSWNISNDQGDSSVSSTTVTSTIFYGGAANIPGIGIGTQYDEDIANDWNRTQLVHGNIHYLRVTCNSNEVILLDFFNGNDVTVPNIGANAPANTDAIWDGDTGYAAKYTYIPAKNRFTDIVDLPLKTIGSPTFKGGNQLDRNYADAPDLAMAGIAVNEDISYDTIASNISRFYREKSDKQIVEGLLAYSDFVEPVGSGAYSFTGVEYLEGSAIGIEHTDTIKISFWFKSDESTNNGSCFSDYDQASSTREGYAIYWFSPASLNYTGRMAFQIIENLALGYRITTVCNSVVVDGNWHFIEIEYDGSGNASGVSFTIDGIADTVEIVVDTLNGGTTVSGNPYRYGLMLNGGAALPGDCLMSDLKMIKNGSTVLHVPSEEENGLIGYDVSGNNNHGILTLGGSPLSGFHVPFTEPQIIHNLKYGYKKAFHIGSDNPYIKFPSDVSEFRVNNWKLRVGFVYYDDAAERGLGQIEGTNDGAWQGIMVKTTTGGAAGNVRLGVYGTFFNLFVAGNLSPNVAYVLEVTNAANLGLDAYIYSNGVLVASNTSITYKSPAWAGTNERSNLIGASQSINGATPGIGGYGQIMLWEFYETDADGVVIAELWKTDFNNSDETTVISEAANQPSNFIGTEQVTGVVEYAKVPASLNNPGFDVNGEAISNQAQVDKYSSINNYLVK